MSALVLGLLCSHLRYPGDGTKKKEMTTPVDLLQDITTEGGFRACVEQVSFEQATRTLGHELLSGVDLTKMIGNTCIDEAFAKYMAIWTELTDAPRELPRNQRKVRKMRPHAALQNPGKRRHSRSHRHQGRRKT